MDFFQKMQADQYINTVVQRKTPQTYLFLGSHVKPVTDIASQWAGRFLNEIKLSGSHAKGTSVTGSNDVDIFVSLHNNALTQSGKNTLGEIYKSLADHLKKSGYAPRLQNVSIGIKHGHWQIDVIPAVRYQTGMLVNDHWLYKRKQSSRTKTNIDVHINQVKNSGRTANIKALKIWKDIHGLEFPSFYLELVVIEALKGAPTNDPSGNLYKIFEYLINRFETKIFLDPANSANKVSDDLTTIEKKRIRDMAYKHRYQTAYWENILW